MRAQGKVWFTADLHVGHRLIQRLHQPMMFPVGAKPEHWVKLCSVCCFEESSNRQTEDCELCHEHTAEGPGCSTAEIIARAGL